MEMQTEETTTTPQQRLKQAGTASLIGAAIMLYFGFVHLGQPDGTDWFSRAALVLYHTLRIGGVAFVLVGLLLHAGWAPALMLDATLALPTGSILILSGIVMLADGGNWLNTLILVFCGGSFLTTGWRNASEYLRAHRPIRNI